MGEIKNPKMSKKRTASREFTPLSVKHQTSSKKNDEKCSQAENMVLGFLYTADKALNFAQLSDKFSNTRHKEEDISSAVHSLLRAGLIMKDSKKRFKLHKNILLYEGTLTQHPKGFGFIRVTKSCGNCPSLTRDPFVSPGQMGDAHHGDRVLLRVFRIRADERPESSVIKILVPGADKVGGIYQHKGRERLVFPDDRRFPFTIKISGPGDLQPKNGDGVIAQFDRTSGSGKYLEGKIVEILGAADDVDTQMRLVIEQFNLAYQFSVEILQETENLNESFVPDEDREDLRPTAHVTIDGESAKDFDDAICVLKTRKGYRLFVSIADVSHFVIPGSAIDREAYNRGTSVYFPGRVIPMLPEKLSNNLCSLVPDQDRFTVSAILDFDRLGNLHKKRFCRSIIRSRQRFTYAMVQKILIDKDQAARKEHKPFLTGLKWAQELATALQAKRKKRGSIDFNLIEAEFILADSGKIKSIHPAKRNFAHQIIEECMLAANEAVAELFSRRNYPFVYRVHEPPDITKAEHFSAFIKTLGLPVPPFSNTAAWFAEVLEKSRETRYEYILNNLLLRSMQQARYAAENVGHFGLAAADYTHFTSPIRRYPDLIVHRQLLQLTQGTRQKKHSFAEAAEFLSARERTAVMAERDMNERLKIGYMSHRRDEIFSAIISGVIDNGLYVEIQELCVSGLLPITELGDEHYFFDKKNYRLFGEISAKTYQIGDSIQVAVDDVDILSKKILFSLAITPTQ